MLLLVKPTSKTGVNIGSGGEVADNVVSTTVATIAVVLAAKYHIPVSFFFFFFCFFMGTL